MAGIRSCGFCYDKGCGTRLRTGMLPGTGREFARHVFPAVVTPARTLWEPRLSLIFFCFGVNLPGVKPVERRRLRSIIESQPGGCDGELIRLLMAGG